MEKFYEWKYYLTLALYVYFLWGGPSTSLPFRRVVEYKLNICLWSTSDCVAFIFCFGDFLSLTVFVINKACMQYMIEIELKSYKGEKSYKGALFNTLYKPRRFALVGPLLRLAFYNAVGRAP